MTASFSPTHQAPIGGLPAWVEPDPSLEEDAYVDAGVGLEIQEHRGTWARVTREDGWSGWVDGRRLLELPPSPIQGRPTAGPSSRSARVASARRALARLSSLGRRAAAWGLAHRRPAVVAGAVAVLLLITVRSSQDADRADDRAGAAADFAAGRGSGPCGVPDEQFQALGRRHLTLVESGALSDAHAFLEALLPLREVVARAVAGAPAVASELTSPQLEALDEAIVEIRAATESQAALAAQRATPPDVFAEALAVVESVGALLCGADTFAPPEAPGP